MYKITDLNIYATVTIELEHKKDTDSKYCTNWDVFDCDIVELLDGYSFEQMPSENEVKELVIDLIDEYVERIKDSYDVSQMSMCIVRKDNKSCDDLNMNDLEWGIIEDIKLILDNYEVEQKQEVFKCQK